MYNMMHGVNPVSKILLIALDLKHHKLNPGGKWPVGRFRDIHLSGDGSKIDLFTRNGGGNRECWDFDDCSDNVDHNSTIEIDGETYNYKDTPEAFHSPDCLVFTNWRLTQHPNYVKDYDDEFDYTYAHFLFKAPPELDEALDKILTAQGGAPKSFEEKFTAVMDEMKKMTREELSNDPRFEPLTKIVKKIGEKVAKV